MTEGQLAPALKDALRISLRAHEIGQGTPYRLCFARKGKSGASFGFMQGDLAAGQSEARSAFCTCLERSGFKAEQVETILRKLTVPCPVNPLSTDETEAINEAFEAHRPVVDAMDEVIFHRVELQVEHAIAEAAKSGRTITDQSVLYIGLWINMSGAPTELLRWLRGEQPRIQHVPDPAGNPVDVDAIESYLKSTYYYSENPNNFTHMRQCVAMGMKHLANIG